MLRWLRKTPPVPAVFLFLGGGGQKNKTEAADWICVFCLSGSTLPARRAAAITRMKRGRGDGGSRRGWGGWWWWRGGGRKHNNGPHYLCLEQEAEQWLRDGGGPSHTWGEVNTPPPSPRLSVPPPPTGGGGGVGLTCTPPAPRRSRAPGCTPGGTRLREGKERPSEFLPLPPFVRRKLRSCPAFLTFLLTPPPPPRGVPATVAAFSYLSCSWWSGWSSPPCTPAPPGGRTRSGRSSRPAGGTPCCTWGRSSARRSAP